MGRTDIFAGGWHGECVLCGLCVGEHEGVVKALFGYRRCDSEAES